MGSATGPLDGGTPERPENSGAARREVPSDWRPPADPGLAPSFTPRPPSFTPRAAAVPGQQQTPDNDFDSSPPGAARSQATFQPAVPELTPALDRVMPPEQTLTPSPPAAPAVKPASPAVKPAPPAVKRPAPVAPAQETRVDLGRSRLGRPRPPVVRRPSEREPAPDMPHGEIVLESPPEIPEQASGGLANLMMYLPMGAMALGMAVSMAGSDSGKIQAVSGGAMGGGMVLMMVSQMFRGRNERKNKINGLRRDYLRYLGQVRAKARRAAQEQRGVMEHGSPAPEVLQAMALAGHVWQRTPSSPDYLSARFAVGTQGLAIRLTPPETKPVEDLDPLCVGALRTFIRMHSQVPALPVAVRLSAFTRIVPTGDRDAIYDMARALVAQVAAAHSPADVKIAVCASPERIGDWEWLKWVAHNGHPTETDAAGPARLMVPSLDWLGRALEPEFRSRPRFAPGASGGHGAGQAGGSHPFYLVIADGIAVPPESEVIGIDGVTILDLSEIGRPARRGPLPEPGVLRLRVTQDHVYRVSGEQETQVGVPDVFSLVEAESLARVLAPMQPPSGDTPSEDVLAADVSLAALLGVPDPYKLDIASLWRTRAPRDLLRVPIGTDASGAPMDLDIKEAAQGGMGPHGLVIGATGSGKSELLRTLVLGLATTHSPDEINFVLVDFKGGATFNGWDDLPHVSAVITNLSDELPLVDRMRDAMSGELNRRQELLRAAGYANVRDYRKARLEGASLPPLPTLFMVLDEFSELLAAKPEFIELFVSIGRIGRSIGVHILLASQRLEEGRLRGLDTQISYRIGLRTFSAAESRVVLGVPDAYSLPQGPGNGYLKVEDLTRFKAAYVSGPVGGFGAGGDTGGGAGSGADGKDVLPAHLRPAIAPFGPAFIEPTFETVEEPVADGALPSSDSDDKPESLMDIIIRQLKRGTGPNTSRAHRIWLPPLNEPPSLDFLLPQLVPGPRGLTTGGGEGHASLGAPIGIVDKPYEQRRDPFWVDLSGAAGHVAVAGGPRSGKSVALRTLISSLALLHTPQEAQFYVLDFGGGTLAAMEGLPHLGGVANRLQPDRVRRTVAEVRALLEQRERSFADQGIDSIGTYRRRVAAGEIPGDGFGDVFLVIDGWLSLRQDFEELEPIVTSLAARGLGYGIHLVGSSNKWSEFRPAVRDLFGTKLELRLGDPYESEVGRAAAANVPSGTPGRGLTRDGLHFITAVPRMDERETADGLPEASRSLVGQIAGAWRGSAAPPVRMLPKTLPASSLPAPSGHRIPFGIDEHALATVSADLGNDPHFMVIGDTECGKSNLLRLLVAGIASAFTPQQAQILFIDYRRSLLDASEVPHNLGYVTSSASGGPALSQLHASLVKRLPTPDLTPEQLRTRSWWSGPDVYIVCDDYDLVSGGAGSPLGVLADLLPQARDIGLHLILARAAGGAGRAMFEPVIQRMREMGTPALIMSGSKEEGQLFGGVRPSPLPPGRGFYVERRAGSRLVQSAILEDPAPR